MTIKPLWLLAGAMLATTGAIGAPATQPPGANIVYGDVNSPMPIQPTTGNPAAAAANQEPGDEQAGARGTAVSAGAGLEYGNIENLFEFYDRVSSAYAPSDPGDGGGPIQLPESGIDLGDVLDNLDPEHRELLDALVDELTTQAALLALIAVEGYGKAWLSGDIPVAMGNNFLGGTWTVGLNWSGSSKAFGLVEPVEFDLESARVAITDWFNALPQDRPQQFDISNHITLIPDLDTGSVSFNIRNDSSLVTKSTRTTDLRFGYSRKAWSGEAGRLFLGAEARFLSMQLSRQSVRFGDITNSEELFDSISNADFKSDQGFSLNVGALWAANNYQLGAQFINVNEPEFSFPAVDLDSYRSEGVIGFLLRDQTYTMDRQLKLEGSVFTDDRRWSAHMGLDVDPATDPMGDRFQWATLSAGFNTGKWWLPNARVGFRRNLTGTELSYVGVGVTAFKYLNLDIASALDTVKLDGTTLPQGLMGSIGFQIAW